MRRPPLLSLTFGVGLAGCGPEATRPATAPAPATTPPSLPPGVHCDTESCSYYSTYPGTQEWTQTPRPLGDVVVCEFRGAAYASYDDVPHQEPSPQFELRPGEVLRVTFTGLGSQHPRVKGNSGEAPLELLKNTEAEWLLVEQTAGGIPVFYNISKLTRSIIWTKAYTTARGRPFGFLSVGRCF